MSDAHLSLDNYLPYRLAVTSTAVSNLVSKVYESRYGLKIPEWRIVAVLSEDGPLSQYALVPRTAMDKVTVSRAAVTLSRRRLIKRAPHDRDGRSHILYLTEDGKNLYRDVAPIAKHYESLVLQEFTPDQITELKLLLLKCEVAALHAISVLMRQEP